MFRRNKSETDVSPTTTASTGTATAKPGGKGRPTPTRKEAEAAARARAKAPRTRKEQAKAQRAARAESSQQVRAAMKAGDERYYLPRDRGPVRRFVRDFVDTRFSIIELMIPLLIVTMVLGYSGNQDLASFGNTLLIGTLLLVVMDMVFLRFRLRRQLARRFPDAETKGTTYYAVTRAMQMKFMRLPKAQVKIGQDLPEHYR
ncbi:DUF3043 domain-containing protein [Nocardioides sp. SYSU DS0663]|uniref:DUF3043 domain-containing protein n=1 Tax=Nocardioides sp. SYSU DS0663 TaxID=3416445 RepID=UPI003F4C0C80